MTDYTNIPRDSRRVPLATRVQLKFDRFSGFISEYSANISPTGMFIVSNNPEPPGRVLDLELRLGDGFEIIKGTGEVVWCRTTAEGPLRPPGMGIRFRELGAGSRELIYRIVDRYVQEGGTPFDLADAPAQPPLPPLDREPDPFPDLETDPVKDSSGIPLPWFADAPDAKGGGEPPRRPATVVPLRAADPPRAETPRPMPVPFPQAVPPPAAAAPVPLPAELPRWEGPSLQAEEAEPDAYLPKPVPLADPPPPRTLASLAGSAAAHEEPRRILPLVVIGALLVLAAAGYLLKDRLLGLFGVGHEDEAAEAQLQPRRALPKHPRRLPAPGDTAGLTSDAAASPLAAPPAPAPAAPAASPEPTPLPEVVRRKPAAAAPAPAAAVPLQTQPAAPAPAAGPAVTAIERITFEPATAGGTDVVVWGNGSFRPESYEQSQIGAPPRALFRFRGIERPFALPRIPVGTPEVKQVRVGYHPAGSGHELHVVIDLAAGDVKVVRVDRDGQRLRIHLQRGS